MPAVPKKLFLVLHALVLIGVAAFGAHLIFQNKFGDIPPVPNQLACISYEPIRPSLQHAKDMFAEVTVEQIRTEIEQLKKYTNCIRVYSVKGNFYYVPEIAEKLGMKVIVGAWIDLDTEDNEAEVDRLIKLLREKSPAITAVVVGNEVQTFNRQPIPVLVQYIKKVQQNTTLPVGTADLYQAWQSGTIDRLAMQADFVGLHVFPYYLNSTFDRAIDNHLQIVGMVEKRMKTQFNKETWLLETGWPSGGTERFGAVPSLRAQRLWLSYLEKWAESTGKTYNLIEAYDQPWKFFDEGRTGTHWGILSAHGKDKLEWYKNIFNISLVLGLICFLLCIYGGFRRIPNKKVSVNLLYHYVSFMFGIGTAMAVYFYAHDYLYVSFWLTLLFGVLQLATSYLLMQLIIYAFAYMGENKEFDAPVNVRGEKKNDFVSIHIPSKNERPEHLIAAIDSCLNQTHAELEVVVVLNNTPDKSLWQPVAAWCKDKSRVKFIHVDGLKGYKAGALNLALRNTDSRATYVAVLDADYIVKPDWIETALRYMGDSKVGGVLFPQAFRKIGNTEVEHLAIIEQKMAFDIGLMPRTHHNATLLQGTMCVLDRALLEKMKGWAEWSAADDTELGLRLAREGKEIVYVHQVFGHGIAPQMADEFFGQRRRWAYGSIGILIRYWKELFFGYKTSLSKKQRQAYMFGWVDWFMTILFFSLLVYLAITVFNLRSDIRYMPYTGFLFTSCLAGILLLIVGVCMMKEWAKRSGQPLKASEIFMMIVLHVAMIHHLAAAALKAILPVHKPFTRTSKEGLHRSKKAWHFSGVDFPKPLGWYLVFSAIVVYFIYKLLDKYPIDFDMGVILLSLVMLGGVYIANAFLFLREFLKS